MAIERVALRADASTRIGTGHVRRSVALADALRQVGVASRFITRIGDVDTLAMIARAGHDAVALPDGTARGGEPGDGHGHWSPVREEEDAQATVALARDADAIVVDHYAFAAPWQNAVARALDVPVAAIDDLAERPMSAALVIDHNVCADPRAKHAASLAAGARLLAGPRYALIDAAYARAERYRFSSEVHSIGLFLGGVDSAALTLSIARALRARGFTGPIGVATTSANPQVGAIRAAADWLGCAPVVDASNLAAFFAAHDVQVGAAGGATWERCCIGVPSLLVAVAQNQRQVIEPLRGMGVAAIFEGAPEAERIADAALALAADPAWRRAISAAAMSLVDGGGAERVAMAVAGLAPGVRIATIDDAAVMHAWRNAPATRAASRNSGEIEREAHDRWLAAVLADPTRRVFIVGAGSRDFGVVRFDRAETGRSSEVSIYLDPAVSGMGLGRAALFAAQEAYGAMAPEVAELIAETLAGNAASQALFASAGYAGGPVRFSRRFPAAEVARHVQDC